MLDDENIDSHADAMSAMFGSPIPTIFRENMLDGDGGFVQQSSNGAIRFHVEIPMHKYA